MEKNFKITPTATDAKSLVIEVGFKSGYVKELPFTTFKMRDECYKDMEEAMMFQVPGFSLKGICINMNDVDYIQKAEYY